MHLDPFIYFWETVGVEFRRMVDGGCTGPSGPILDEAHHQHSFGRTLGPGIAVGASITIRYPDV